MIGLYQVGLLVLQLVIGVATGITLIHFATILMLRAANRERAPRVPDRPLHYIFMVPCLNEELVIEASVKRLLSIPGEATVLVIDDGSTDRTAEIVRSLAEENPRVQLLQRVAPNARQGKGEALNYAYREIARQTRAAGIDPDTVICCVMDADGLLDAHALADVTGYFGHDEIGAVQIGVRITNRQTVLGRLQDIEFFTHARLVQQGRNHLGSTGLGGNGQFTRLSALISLGSAPWTDCLTEDLDLGLQLLLKGWKLAYTDQAFVHQQGLVDISRLVRQRSRWVQGYFQCWRRIPAVVLIEGKWYTAVDLLFSLVWPAVSCLLLPIAVLLSWGVVAWNVVTADVSLDVWIPVLALGYVLAFGTSIVLTLNYRTRSGDMGWWQTILLIHCTGLFQFVWAAAGWRAFFRMVTRQGSWAKTERIASPSTAGS